MWFGGPRAQCVPLDQVVVQDWLANTKNNNN